MTEPLPYSEVQYFHWFDDDPLFPDKPDYESLRDYEKLHGAPPADLSLVPLRPEVAHYKAAYVVPLCMYCGHELEERDLNFKRPRRRRGPLARLADHYINPGPEEITGSLCHNCGWWLVARRLEDRELFTHSSGAQHEFAAGVLHRSEGEDYLEPIEGLRTYLAKRPDMLSQLSPTQFERVMTSALRDHFDGAEVTHVGGTGDGGVDIVVMRGGRRPTIVQVKRRLSLSEPEGLTVVRELHGVMFRDRLTRGMVVTTAPRFTAGAHQEVALAAGRFRRYEMSLMSMPDVRDLLELPHGSGEFPWDVYGVGWPTGRNAAWSALYENSLHPYASEPRS